MTGGEDGALNILGLAKKAKKVISGDFAVCSALPDKKTELVIVAADASERVVEKYRKKTAEHDIPLIVAFTKEKLAKALGNDGLTATVALTDAGFARVVKEKLRG